MITKLFFLISLGTTAIQAGEPISVLLPWLENESVFPGESAEKFAAAHPNFLLYDPTDGRGQLKTYVERGSDGSKAIYNLDGEGLFSLAWVQATGEIKPLSLNIINQLTMKYGSGVASDFARLKDDGQYARYRCLRFSARPNLEIMVAAMSDRGVEVYLWDTSASERRKPFPSFDESMKTKQAAVEGDPIADVVDFVAQSFNNGHPGMPVSHYLLENEAEAVKLVFPWWGI